MHKIQGNQSATKKKKEKDFFIDQHGFVVFTKEFLLRRGFCCGNGCKNCPYNKQQ